MRSSAEIAQIAKAVRDYLNTDRVKPQPNLDVDTLTLGDEGLRQLAKNYGLRRTVVGSVTGSSGAKAAGTGFSSSRSGVGTYTVKLDKPMVKPIIVVTPHVQSVVSGANMTSNTSGSVLMTTPAALVDSDFSFTIVEAA